MATPTTCPQCSSPLAEASKFCGKCGAVLEDRSLRTLMEFAAPASVRGLPLEPTVPDAAAHTPAPTPDANPNANANVHAKMKHTMIGFAAAGASPAAPPAAAPPAPPSAGGPVAAPTASAASQGRVAVGQTMLGIAAPSGAAPVAPPAAAAPPAGQGRAPIGGTMLGVAMPGIAPTAAGEGPAHAPRAGVGGTMLGVAMPGIAPTHGQPPARASQPKPRALGAPVPLEPIVPAPAPLFLDDERIAPPVRASRSGVPTWIVAASLAGVLLIAGVLVAVLWRGSSPIVARPVLDAQGREALHLVCDGCADGTTVELAGSKVTLKAHEADLVLAAPLVIGDNPLALQVNRPGIGRDETVKLVVPVSFRIRADVSTVNAKPPVLTVRVEALPSSEVLVDGKPVALDAQGKGQIAVDVSAETSGPSVETRRVERKFAYQVTHKGEAPSTGVLPAAVGIVPLQLDAPTSHAVTDQKTILVAGQTSVGSAVKINGDAVTPDATGVFSKSLAAPASGELAIDVEASAPQLAPRTVHVAVRVVASLDAEARAAESKPHASYDDVKDDIAGHAGKPIAIEGEIVDTRAAGHQTILVLTDRRGCAGKADPNACLARVLFGGEDKRKKGDVVRVFGRVTRAVPAQNGRSVPEIEADFLARPRGR